MSAAKYWSDADKAFWILQNGEPKFGWIFERNGDTVFRRPIAEPGTKLPPWFSKERKPVRTEPIQGRTVDFIILDEECTKNVY